MLILQLLALAICPKSNIQGTAAMLHENDWQHVLWTTSLDLGTNNNVVYVEDCNFEFDVFGNAIDANYGGAYVFRFNHVSGVYIELHSVQGNNRATRRWEIYGNTIDNPGSSIYYPYRIRAGTGVVFNDTLVGTWTNYGIALDNVRSYDARGDGGKCDGNSTWDGNEDATGYPCRDQIGRGPDNPQWDHDPVGAYTQPLVPAYAWENRRQSNNALVPFKVINSGEDHIQENRDFYNHNASFDGTSGVGTGTLANCPATCTTGVAYWATDQSEWNSENPGPDGQLYKCTSTDTWELYYTPYTYPHPLRGESLVLRATPADQAIHLTWQIGVSLPPTSTWQIAYDGPAGDQPSPLTGIVSPTRAYTLTGLTNYTWYTVTLNGMLDSTTFLTDTVRVMPTDISVYLPLVLKGP